MKKYRITPDGVPNDGIIFVDHSKNNRSGHMGHALVECENGDILAFYPNCSAEDKTYDGHSGFGWMEYKRSSDGGETWSESFVEPNSKALFDCNIGRTFMCEKAVRTDTGRIILFYLQCDVVTNGHIWEPYFEPHYSFSEDNGKTFSSAKQLWDKRGRIYDALYHEGVVYVLFSENPELPGVEHSENYDLLLYTSVDNGETFTLRSRVGFDSMIQRLYGNLCFTPDGRLIAYTYEKRDEFNLPYVISSDNGFTWSREARTHFAKKLRNPQIIYYKDRYFAHGRGKWPLEYNGSLVLYSSFDGVNWDDGVFLRYATAGAGAYSNNIVVRTPDGRERMMLQASHAYEGHKTNIIMYFVDID